MRLPKALLVLCKSFAGLFRQPVKQVPLPATSETAGPPTHGGYCGICEAETTFVRDTRDLRHYYQCLACGSVPRFRAIIATLNRFFPKWRELDIHESSPEGQAADFLKKHGLRYTWSQYFPDLEPGAMRGEDRNEDLTRLTFEDETLDLLITQDVFEHVMEPEQAFREIARVLRPGGAHVFSMPWYPALRRSRQRAKCTDGEVVHVLKAEYHHNPADKGGGSLVTYDWGMDFADFVYRASGLTTMIYLINDPSQAIEGPFLEMFVSYKLPHP